MTYPLNNPGKQCRVIRMQPDQRGFSLIEVALFLLIITVVVISVTPFIKLTSYEYKTASTVKRTSVIAAAVYSYSNYHRVELASKLLKTGKAQEVNLSDLVTEGFLPKDSRDILNDTFGNRFHVIARLVQPKDPKSSTVKLMALITAINENKVKDIPIDMRGEIVSMLGVRAGIEPLSGNKQEIYGMSKNWTIHLQDWGVNNVDYNKSQYFYLIEAKNIISNDIEIFKTESGKISKIDLDSTQQSPWAPIFTADNLLILMETNPDIDFFNVTVTPSSDNKPREYKVLGDRLSLNPEPEWLPIGSQKDTNVAFKVSAHHLSGDFLAPFKGFTLNIKPVSVEDYFNLFFSTGEITVKGWALERHSGSKPSRVSHCNTDRDIQVTKVTHFSLKSAIQDDFMYPLLRPLTLEVSARGDQGVHNIIYRKVINHTGDLNEKIAEDNLNGAFDISNNTCSSTLDHQVQYDVNVFSGGQSWTLNSIVQSWNGQKSDFSTNLFP